MRVMEWNGKFKPQITKRVLSPSLNLQLCRIILKLTPSFLGFALVLESRILIDYDEESNSFNTYKVSRTESTHHQYSPKFRNRTLRERHLQFLNLHSYLHPRGFAMNVDTSYLSSMNKRSPRKISSFFLRSFKVPNWAERDGI